MTIPFDRPRDPDIPDDDIFEPDAIGREHGEEPPPDRPEPFTFTAARGGCVASWGPPLHVSIELDRFAAVRRRCL